MPRRKRPGPKAGVLAFLENELNNRENSGLQDTDHREYVLEARRAVADFKRLIIQEPQTNKLDQRYRDAANDLYGKDGEIEIDDNATISYGDDNGAYVAAWVWVYKDQLPKPAKKFPSGD